MEAILTAQHITKLYGKGEAQIRALDDVNISIQQGQFASIIGQSGSGKTTLLKVLSGLLAPSSGSVIACGQELTTLNEQRLTAFRRTNIGFVFQKYALLPEMTNEENIYLPLKLDGKTVNHSYFEEVFSRLDIEKILKKYPTDCSGGEQQRVAIARAFANRPSIIFADEPTGNLDCERGENVVTLFLMMQRALNTTVIMVTHNLFLANHGDRIFTICDGRITSDKVVDI